MIESAPISAGARDIHPSRWGGELEPVAQLGGLCTHQAGPRARPSCIVSQFVLGQPVVSTQGGVLGFSTTRTVVYWLCVFASLSVVQHSDYWSDPMAIAGLLVWGSGAPRRRQRPLDDTGSSQSCPAASEHGSGSVSRFRSTSSSTRWSVFSFRETLSAWSVRRSSTARELSAHLRRRRRQCFSTTSAHREARMRLASCRLTVCVVRCPQLQSGRSEQSRRCLECQVEGWQGPLREWREFRLPVTLT